VEVLAAQLGVSKGGFYWHFTDRRALLEEMLDSWEKAVVEDVIERIESQPDEPRAKLQHLFELASSVDVLGVELALRDWARRNEDVAARLRGIDNRRMDYMRSLFRGFCPDEDDVEVRCMLAFSLWIGNYFITAQHGERSRARVMHLAQDRLLSESWA
jgi:AcrR family transcriptional regulator